jgi:hypothetical protein
MSLATAAAVTGLAAFPALTASASPVPARTAAGPRCGKPTPPIAISGSTAVVLYAGTPAPKFYFFTQNGSGKYRAWPSSLPAGIDLNQGDIANVGSNAPQYLFDQLGCDYNDTDPSPNLYYWDATSPVTGQPGNQIETRQTCTDITRPNGSSAGIMQVLDNTTDPTNSNG